MIKSNVDALMVSTLATHLAWLLTNPEGKVGDLGCFWNVNPPNLDKRMGMVGTGGTSGKVKKEKG